MGHLRKIIVEVPHLWFSNPIDAEKCIPFFNSLLIATSKFRVPVVLNAMPFGADQIRRNPEKGVMIFSYHSYGHEKNVWRVKESPIHLLFEIDKSGYSGWSYFKEEIIKRETEIKAIDISNAKDIVSNYKIIYEKTRKSKYPQTEVESLILPEKYVFFPMQVQSDPVVEFSRFSLLDVLEKLAHLAKKNKTHLLIKRHPYCNSFHIEKFLNEMVNGNEYVQLVDANIHDLCAKAYSVVVCNSGTGLEALIHGATVYSYGDSEWSMLSNEISELDDFEQVFSPGIGLTDEKIKILAFLLDKYWVAYDSLERVEKRVYECIAEYDPEYGIEPKSEEQYEIFSSVIQETQSKLDNETRNLRRVCFDLETLERLTVTLQEKINFLQDANLAKDSTIDALRQYINNFEKKEGDERKENNMGKVDNRTLARKLLWKMKNKLHS